MVPLRVETHQSRTTPSTHSHSKAISEQVVQEYVPHATILRPTVMFGYEDRLLNKFGYLATLGPWIPMPVDPNTQIQPLFVRHLHLYIIHYFQALDFAAAVMACLNKPGTTSGRVVELGGSEVMTLRELVEEIVLPFTRRDHCKILRLRSPFAEYVIPFVMLNCVGIVRSLPNYFGHLCGLRMS